jgi:hypothetical protein
MDDVKKQSIEDFYEALLSITALAKESVAASEQIFAGIDFFSKMAFDLAPNEKVARDTINAGIDMAFSEVNNDRAGDVDLEVALDAILTLGCRVHGDFEISAGDHIGENEERVAYGCPKCGDKKELPKCLANWSTTR